MKIQELWDEYATCRQELNETARKLAIVATAICWFFKLPDVTFPNSINFALFFIVIFFTFDLLQFISATLMLKFWTRHHEIETELQTEKEENNNNLEVDHLNKPALLNQVPLAFYFLKLLFLTGAFIALAHEIYTRMT